MRRLSTKVIVVIVIAALAGGAVAVRGLRGNDTGVIVISGRAEADEIALAARVGGRLSEVLVRDGQSVAAGELVAKVDDDALRAKLLELERAKEEAAEHIRAKERDIAYSEKLAGLSLEESEQAVAIAQARLRQAEARRSKAQSDLDRAAELFNSGVINDERRESAQLSLDLASEEEESARRNLDASNISMRKALALGEAVDVKRLELSAFRKTLARTEEQRRQAEISLSYAEIRAPLAGVVLRRVMEPGEVVGAGGAVAVMIDPASMHIRTYLPEPYLGRVSIGSGAEVITDAYPDKPITGRLCHIADKAEFTPKEVQSKEERVKQVFSAKVCFDSPPPMLKKGMPVDVRLSLQVPQAR